MAKEEEEEVPEEDDPEEEMEEEEEYQFVLLTYRIYMYNFVNCLSKAVI